MRRDDELVPREAGHRWRAWRLPAELLQDLRYAFRMMRRNRGFTAVAVVSLALGIGANTAIFSLIDALMLRTLPVRDPHRLVQLMSRYPGEPRIGGFSWSVFEHFRDNNDVFADLIAISPFRFQVIHDGRDPETLDGHYVTGNFFSALGVQPILGRLIGPEDDKPGAADAAVAVVSWSCWQHRFNRDAAIVGKRIVVHGVPAVVIGVTPRAFSGVQIDSAQEIWVPVGMEPLIQRPSGRMNGRMGVGLIGRLGSGVSLEGARAEMDVLNRWRTEEIARATNDPLWRQAMLEVVPAGAGVSAAREYFERPLLVLMAVVALLLLIACGNVASMLLARAAARQKEIAVRVSLGAGRARIVRQVLTESVLLSLAGAALGLVVAYYGAAALVAVIASGRPLPGLGPLVIHPAININVLLFTGVAAVLTGVLFGMAPVWHALAGAPMASLREIQATGETRSRRVFGKSLVAAQVALSVTVLSVAGLLVHHLSNLRNVDVGFERDSVLLVTVDPARSGYKATQLAHLYKDLLARLAAIPGVRSATMSAPTPIAGGAASRFIKVEGFEEDQDARRRVALTWIGPGYFETFRTAILAGRDFQPADESGPRVALVNRATARHYFGNRNPLGRRFTFEGETAAYEIVGVAGDAKYSDLHEPAPRTVYLNAFRDAPGRVQQFALRTSVPPLRVAGDVRGVIRDALKTVAVAKITTLADQVDASLVPERLIVAVSGLFAAFGALLASVGLYGLLSHAVARRVNEFGVRMALGATRRDIMRMVLEGALGLVGAGIVAGALLAIWSQRLAANLVANLPEDRLSPILVASILMIAVALLAACVPARRAARINPIDALRHL